MAESAFSNLVWNRPVDPTTIGGMSDLRLLDLNLIYLIKERLLPINGYISRYSETVYPINQTIDQETGLYVTPFQATYKDFTYYNPDPSNPALTGLIVTPRLGTTNGLAWIDYQNGTVYYSGNLSDPVTMEYDYYTVKVQDGFPDLNDETDLENLAVPAISIDYQRRDNTPFQLGGGYKVNRDFILNITAVSDSQRDDLMDILETSLRYTYNDAINYKFGFPVDFRGDKNPNFDRGLASYWKQFLFNHVNSSVLRDASLPDKLRHQANIMLNIEVVL